MNKWDKKCRWVAYFSVYIMALEPIFVVILNVIKILYFFGLLCHYALIIIANDYPRQDPTTQSVLYKTYNFRLMFFYVCVQNN